MRQPGFDNVSFVELSHLGSNALSFADIARLGAEIEQRFAAQPQGFVVLQGTDTAEETAFLLDLLLPRQIAVVMAGAMRTADAAGADGPANLTDAILAVRAVMKRPCGVMLCMGSELHSAALVRKTDANRPHAFTSPGFGPLGYVAEGACRLLMRPAAHPGPYKPLDTSPPIVGQLAIYFDIRPEEVAATLSAPYDGLVVAGLGAGTMPPAIDPLIAAAAARIPVLMSSRCGRGEVALETYVGAGTTHNLLPSGIIPSGFLDFRKARILLTVLLWSGFKDEVLKRELALWRALS
jgi:L-asparaginase